MEPNDGFCGFILQNDIEEEKSVLTDRYVSKSEYSLDPTEAFDIFSSTVYRLARTRTGSTPDAEDVMQEVFLRYIRKKPVFTDLEHAKAWFIKVTLRCTISFLTLRGKSETDALPENLYTEMPAENALSYAVSCLPIDMRTVIYLYYFEGYSVEETAKLTGVRQGTVKSRLARAREKLKIELTENV